MKQMIYRRPVQAREDNRVHAVAFTGKIDRMMVSYENDPCCADLKKRLLSSMEMLVLDDYTHFILCDGTALDIFAAELVLQLRQKYSWVTLELVAAPGTALSADLRRRRNLLRTQADIVTLGCRSGSHRTDYMITGADVLLAVHDGRLDSVHSRLLTADDLGKQVTVIPPVINAIQSIRYHSCGRPAARKAWSMMAAGLVR